MNRMSEPNPPISTSTLDQYHPLPEPVGPPPRKHYWLHALLLLATCFTTLIMGARMQYNFDHNQPALSFSDEKLDYVPWNWIRTHPGRILAGIPFSATVMLFFLAHELGHYLTCRRYGVYATLPFFIPMPTPRGTMGAVILIRSPIRSRKALFDIAIAGPIAGFVVAAIALVASLALSKPLPHGAGAPDYEITFPLIFEWVHRGLASAGLIHGAATLPLNRVLLHPIAIAAWVGMFATALNLLPGGQLDGGHITFAISPRAHRYISWLTIGILVPMAYYLWVGWWLWAVLLQLSSLRHPRVGEAYRPQITGMRAWLAVLALAMLAVTLTPSPFAHISTIEVIRQMRGR
jgi:membrane-associated protease RseP (regulator of RpoE activity)